MSEATRRLGADGEAVAALWYRRRGYTVVEQNWRCRQGELDLIVTRRGELVVCEVKTRRSDRYGSGAAAVDERKQATIRRVTSIYLGRRAGRAPRGVRFDVAVVTAGAHGFAIEVIEHAF